MLRFFPSLSGWPFGIIILFAFLFSGCSNPDQLVQRTDYGRAQGSTYAISYVAPPNVHFQPAIDSILEVIDQSMSTYRPNSLISRINRGEVLPLDEHFKVVLANSVEVHRKTDGFFDPTVYPIMKLWNFERKRQQVPDSVRIDSAMQFVGLENVDISNTDSFALPKGYKLDFNAIAQGYTVDVIAEFLESRGVLNYLVEVGGELRTLGKNIDGDIWKIGIEEPLEEKSTDKFQRIIALKDAGLATSGSYRKFIEDTLTGNRYSHALNPKNGRATKNPLMSVTVIAPSCMDADAYATAILVMGLESARKFMQKRKDLGVYLIHYDKYRGWQEEENETFSSIQ
ncbi:MAG: FAD:protein FMN transferase [Cryomorphaceae bacterium]|nr:FAD:protein FMN transferase [Cryomorphaceae bacterium]